jgi:dihydroorotate dehydrogenase (NAD+) catalytic subunit
LEISIANLKLSNPTILASGIMGYSCDSFQRIADDGAGAVITKSIGLEPRTGYVNPTIFQAKYGFINAMGLPNPGIDEYSNEISKAKSRLNVPLIVSIYGYTIKEYLVTAKKAIEAGADALELNISCPHVKKTGSEIGQNPDLLAKLIRQIKSVIQKPVIAKLTPNVTNIIQIAQAAVDSGIDALTATNTVKAIAIDIETTKPVLSNTFGGLSGPAIKPITLRCVYELYENIDIPIIGCGGITDWIDAVEFFLAGASAIQIGSAVALRNTRVFNKINKGITKYLKKKRIKSVEEIVGLSHKK